MMITKEESREEANRFDTLCYPLRLWAWSGLPILLTIWLRR
jgi:hypothetical protein